MPASLSVLHSCMQRYNVYNRCIMAKAKEFCKHSVNHIISIHTHGVHRKTEFELFWKFVFCRSYAVQLQYKPAITRNYFRVKAHILYQLYSISYISGTHEFENLSNLLAKCFNSFIKLSLSAECHSAKLSNVFKAKIKVSQVLQFKKLLS